MQINRICPLTGKSNTLDLNVTHDQMMRFMEGEDLIQNIFPNLTPGEREFIKSGTLESTYDKIFLQS
jgi:hypothetical protein